MKKFGHSMAFGRRAMPRSNAPALAVLSTATTNYAADLMDLSRTGARLEAECLPRIGEDLVFQAEKVRCPAAVVWLAGRQCAIEFDTPLAGGEVKHIRALSDFGPRRRS